jgi:hypothetical protein
VPVPNSVVKSETKAYMLYFDCLHQFQFFSLLVPFWAVKFPVFCNCKAPTGTAHFSSVWVAKEHDTIVNVVKAKGNCNENSFHDVDVLN